jgi:hypothetical protein
MKLGWWMLAGSVLSSFGITSFLGAAVAPDVRLAVWLGMIGPLAAALATWRAVERQHARQPEGLLNLLMKAFAAKIVFFAVYVALMIKAGWVRPVPFAISFLGYFAALHIAEAWRLHSLFPRS